MLSRVRHIFVSAIFLFGLFSRGLSKAYICVALLLIANMVNAFTATQTNINTITINWGVSTTYADLIENGTVIDSKSTAGPYTTTRGNKAPGTYVYSVNNYQLVPGGRGTFTVSSLPNQTIIIAAGGAAPTISPISNVTINEGATVGASTGAINFTVSDAETSASFLTVTATSSNTALIPAANLVITGNGSGNARTLTAQQVLGVTGQSTITLSTSDGTSTTTTSFIITVAPTKEAQSSNTIPDINTSNYDIYYGDLNGDGKSDYYFHGKSTIVILHGDIAIPIYIAAPKSFVVYRNGAGYTNPEAIRFNSDVLTSKINSNNLRIGQANSDFYIWSDIPTNQRKVLLRGADTASPSLLLLSSTSNGLPSIGQIFQPNSSANISDRALSIALGDFNSDGRNDIVINGYIYLSNSSGAFDINPMVKANSPAAVTATLDQLTGVPNITWSAVNGVTRYEVQAKLNGSDTGNIQTLTSNSLTPSTITSAGVYTYAVRSCIVSGTSTNCSSWTLSNSVTPEVPGVPVVGSPLASVNGVYAVRSSRVIGATHYQIYENNLLIQDTSDWVKVFDVLTAKTTGSYFYQVRACKAVCSALSNMSFTVVTLGFNNGSSSASSNSYGAASSAAVQTSSVTSNTSSVGNISVSPAAFDPLNDPMAEGDYLEQLTGSPSVNKDGSFLYSVAIKVAPGINGVQPELTLSYNSANGTNGYLGVGWSLSGLSVIERCKASLVRDGYVSGVENGEQYKYCLDGQRLVEISSGIYRLEKDDFSKIEKLNNYWLLTGKNGRKVRFGNNADSVQVDNKSAVYAWYMDKVEDVAGNYLTISYDSDSDGQNFRAGSISYTKNPIGGINNSVVFHYENRDDLISKYVAGGLHKVTKRLSQVEIKINETSIRNYNFEYQNYGQIYFGKKNEDPLKTSRLEKINLCVNTSSCAAPLEFDWTSVEKQNYGFADNSTNVMNGYSYWDGKDLSGFIGGWGSDPQAGDPLRNQFQTGDFNGDGNMDVFYTYNSFSLGLLDFSILDTEFRIRPHANKVSKSDPIVPNVNNYVSLCPDGSANCRFRPGFNAAMDVNGDGKDDLVYFGTITNNWAPTAPFMDTTSYVTSGQYVDGIIVRLSRGDNSFDDAKWLFVTPTPQALPETQVLMDFNGDGLVDYLGYNRLTGKFNIRDNSGGTFSERRSVLGAPTAATIKLWYHNYSNSAYSNIRVWVALKFGDFNGDGLIDIYGCEQSAKNSKLCYPSVMLNSNGTFAQAERWGNTMQRTGYEGAALHPSSDIIANSGSYEYGEYLADVNGDGKTDLIYVDYGKSINVALSNGHGFEPFQNWTTAQNILGFTTTDVYGNQITIGGGLVVDGQYTSPAGISFVDINNDGCADIVANGSIGDNGTGVIIKGVATGILVSLSNCSYNSDARMGFTPPTAWSTSYAYQALMGGNISFDGARSPAILLDLDGGGAIDSYLGVSKFISHKIISVKAGVNNSQGADITYSALNNPSVYKKSDASINVATETKGYTSGKSTQVFDNAATEVTFKDSVDVVSLLKVADGVNGQRSLSYFYEGYKRHKNGYGSLGFEKITTTETISSTSSMKTIDEYLQEYSNNYILAEVLRKSSKYAVDASGSKLLAESFYNWKVRTYSDDMDSHISPHYFAYLLEQQTKNYDLKSGTWISTVTQQFYNDGLTTSCPEFTEVTAANRLITTDTHFDTYGTPLNAVQKHCDVFGVTGSRTNNTNITNDSSKWLLGLVQDPYSYSWIYNSTSSVTDTKTRHSTFTFDDKGRVKTEVKEPDAGADIKITQVRAYNDYGTVNSLTETVQDFVDDGVDFTTRTTSTAENYDADGIRTLETTNDYGQVFTQIFDPKFGLENATIDANGLMISKGYDDFGRLIQITNPDNTKINFDYKVCSACFDYNSTATWYRQSKATGLSAKREYFDGLNRSVGARARGFAGDFNYQVNVYNSRGKLYSTSAPFRAGQTIPNTITTYDLLDRPVEVDFPNTGIQTVSYQVNSGAASIITTDSKSNKKSQSFDALGREKTITDALGTVTSYTHDGLGNIKEVTVQGKNGESPITHRIDYDLLSRKIALHDPDVGDITYTYNAFGQLATQTNALGETLKYTYDKLNRQIKRVDPAITTNVHVNIASRTHQWIYDTKANAIGKLGSVIGFDTQGNAFTEDYTYNAYGQISETVDVISGNTYKIVNQYDNFSRPRGLSYPTGFTLEFDYNNYGFQSKVLNANTNATLWEAANDDAFGHLTDFTFGNAAHTTKSFNSNTGFVETIQVNRNGEAIQNHQYSFDTEGNLRSRQDKLINITQNFCYDTLYRLTSSLVNQNCSDVLDGYYANAQFGYDINGNLIKKEGNSDYQYGTNISSGAGPHAVIHALGRNYQYDAAGRIKSGTGRIIEYSAFGKPTYMSKDGYQTQVVYGPLEKRVRRLDIEDGALTTTTYVGKLYEKIESPTGTEHRHYMGDFGIHIVDGGGQTYNVYQHLDHIGSIAAKTDDKSGASANVKFMANEPWGQRQEKTWNGQVYQSLTGVKLKEMTYGTARGFTGHEHLDGVGLIHMNGRVYDPVIGRFVSPDPWIQDPKNSQSFNRYSYVWNNPLRYSDPTGEVSLEDVTRAYTAVKSAINKVIVTVAAVIKVTDEAAKVANSAIDVATSPVTKMVIENAPQTAAIAAGIEAYKEPTAVNIGMAIISPIPGAHAEASAGETLVKHSDDILHSAETLVKDLSSKVDDVARDAVDDVKKVVSESSIEKKTEELASRKYDRPAPETKSPTAVKQSEAADKWDEFLGPNQTNIDPRDGLPDPDRIWSEDGLRSIRFGSHEMDSAPNKFHYHQETWFDDHVENILQRIPK